MAGERPGSERGDVAWLVVVAKAGRSLPTAVRRLASTPEPGCLDTAPKAHDSWIWNGSTALAAWADTPEAPWVVRGSRVTVVCGDWRERGRSWPIRSIADGLDTAVEQRGLRWTVADSVGAFAAASFDGRSGYVAADPMGFAFVYQAETDSVTCFASHAPLAAWAACGEGRRPVADHLSSTATAYAPYHIGNSTGYADVTLLPESTSVELSDGSDPLQQHAPEPWFEATDPTVDHVEAVHAAVEDELRAALELPGDQHYVDLTGGKDSRAVLAVALQSGIAGDFVFRTAGPETLSDVRVASELADRFGLYHETGAIWPIREKAPYRERATRFVRRTNGTVNLWDLKERRPDPPEVRVSGMTGECLRAHRAIHPVPADHDAVYATMRRSFRGGSLDLLLPDVRERHDALLAVELRPGADGRSPLDALATFHIRNRARKYRGPMDALDADWRIWPLASVQAVRAGCAMGGEDRQDEIVHFELMRRCDPELAAHPFAGPGWVDRLEQRLGPIAASAGRQTPSEELPAPKPEALTAAGHRREEDERLAFVREVIDDDTNPAWDLLDRTVAIDAAENYATLKVKQRRQLFASATSALWARMVT